MLLARPSLIVDGSTPLLIVVAMFATSAKAKERKGIGDEIGFALDRLISTRSRLYRDRSAGRNNKARDKSAGNGSKAWDAGTCSVTGRLGRKS
jgi:hypothetical protein